VVFVFGLVNGNWVLQAKLAPPDATVGSQFGTIAAIDGNMLAVGAPGAPGAAPFSGAVYLFTKADRGWVQTAKLAASDGAGLDTYGLGLDLNSGMVAVGAPSHNLGAGNAAGAVYLYQIEDGKATQFAEFAGSDIGPGGNFGLSVSLRAGILLVGGPGQHPQPNNNPFYPEGEAYIYRIDH
jgi:hypothetical protein